MDGEPIRVIAQIDGLVKSLDRVHVIGDRLLCILERLERPLKVALFGIGASAITFAAIRWYEAIYRRKPPTE
jgi:hypothetical protein